MNDDRPPTVVVQPSQGVVGVASDTVGALRGSPTLLVIVVLNCVFLAAAAYYLRAAQDNAYGLINKMFDRCMAERSFVPPSNDHQGLGDYPPSPLGSLP